MPEPITLQEPNLRAQVERRPRFEHKWSDDPAGSSAIR